MPKQAAIRLPDEDYVEMARRATRARRKVTPYLRQLLIDASKSPALSECISVPASPELRAALVAIGKELGMSPAGILCMAADKILPDLAKLALEARASRQEAVQQLAGIVPGP